MFSFNIFSDYLSGPFKVQYKCYSVSLLPGNERQDIDRGGKIIMPPSALSHLTRLNVEYPMLFKLTNTKTNRITHCGVLEFVADEGSIYLPHWMMRNLLLEEGNILSVEYVTLPIAVYSKFQPQSIDFLDISNHKALLENALRNFACLTTGDILAIEYNDEVYELLVLETKPGKAVSIIECDMNVEFAAPVGYKEKGETEESDSIDEDIENESTPQDTTKNFTPFVGSGYRIDGKNHKIIPLKTNTNCIQPDYDFSFNKLVFFRGNLKKSEVVKKDESFKPFTSKGNTLKNKL